MRLLQSHVNGVKLWFILISIAACFMVMAVLLDAPKLVKPLNLTTKNKTVFSNREASIKIDGIVFKVSVAETKEAREKGLGGVRVLKQREGMLFVFDKSSVLSMWMKDMIIPIDIIWINSGYKIVHMEKDVLPSSYPNTYENVYPAKFVLEVPAGTIDTFSINSMSNITIND